MLSGVIWGSAWQRSLLRSRSNMHVPNTSDPWTSHQVWQFPDCHSRRQPGVRE